MKAFVGANVLYRPVATETLDTFTTRWAATCTELLPDGSIVLTVFPPYEQPIFKRCFGWSHFGSNPEAPAPNTWQWQTAMLETGMFGRGFIAEIMKSPTEWASVLMMFANLDGFREQYRAARANAIARDWPDLPELASGMPCGCDPKANHKCERHTQEEADAGVH